MRGLRLQHGYLQPESRNKHMSAVSPAAGAALVERLRAEHVLVPATEPLQLIETHISWLLVGSAHAWKLKKPVDLGFVDFSTLQRREYFCREELRLNRRFNPGLYLAVRPIIEDAAGLRIGADDQPLDASAIVEWTLVMRAFSQADRLDVCLQTGRLGVPDMVALGRRLAALHASAPVAEPAAGRGTAQAVAARTADTLASLVAAAGPLAERGARLAAASAEASGRLAAVFERRLADGRVRECHGDLHLSNLVRQDGEILPFDCIEFDPELRWIDVMADLAFVLMDLDVRGRADLGWPLLNAWLGTNGDYDALRVLRYYQAYRSAVRALVAALQLHQGVDPDASRGRCEDHLGLAERYLAVHQPVLILMCGLSGSGKSWLAERLAPLIGAAWLRSDVERKRLHGMGPLDRAAAGPDGGIYSAAAGERVSERLRDCAAAALDGGVPLIVDATFISARQRARFATLAADRGGRALTLLCDAPEHMLRQRIRTRQAAGDDPSDADEAVLDLQLGRFERPEPDAADVLVFAPGDDVAATAAAIRQRLALVTP